MIWNKSLYPFYWLSYVDHQRPLIFLIASISTPLLALILPLSFRFSHTKEINKVTISSQLKILNYSNVILFSFEPIAWHIFKNYSRLVISLDCSWLTDFWIDPFFVSKHSVNNDSVLLNRFSFYLRLRSRYFH